MKLKHYPPTPKLGDTKTIIKFAWWPTRVEDSLIWLERYEEVWTFSVCYSSLGGKLPNPLPYDDWKFTCKNLYSRYGLPDFKNPPPSPLKEGVMKSEVKGDTGGTQGPPPTNHSKDPDATPLHTQIDVTKVIAGNPNRIREDFKTKTITPTYILSDGTKVWK